MVDRGGTDQHGMSVVHTGKRQGLVQKTQRGEFSKYGNRFRVCNRRKTKLDPGRDRVC